MVLGYLVWPTATAGKTPQLLLTIGSRGYGPGQFSNSCWAMACRGDEIIVCASYHVSVFNKHGKFLRPFAQGRIWNSAISIALSEQGHVFIVNVNTLVMLRQDGSLVRQMLGLGHGVAVDSKQELLFVSNARSYYVEVLSFDGRLVRTFGTNGTGDGQFKRAEQLAFSAAGELAVSDSVNHRVQVCCSV